MTTPMTVSEAKDQIVTTMTEKTLQAFVVEAARRLNWRVYHTFDSRRSASGFPDLVMVRDGHLIVAELKRHGKEPTEAQRGWLAAFERVPGEVTVTVWTPTEWVSGQIIRMLEGDQS